MRVSSSLQLGNENFISPLILTSSQIRMDSLVSSFSEQATDWRQLLAMSAGSFAFQGARALGLASRMGNVFSSGLGLASEAAAFGGVNRSLRNREEECGTFLENWKRDFINFGIMKGVGALLATHHVFLRHGVSSVGMMCGSEATSYFGWTPQEQGTFAERLVHGIAMSLSLEVGTQAFALMSGRGLQRISQSIEKRAEFARQCALSLVEESRVSGTWAMSSEGGRPRVIAEPLTRLRGNEHPIKRIMNGALFGLKMGAFMGFFAGAVIGGVFGFASFFDVVFSGSSFWMKGAMLMLGTALGATMAACMGTQLGGGLGSLAGLAVTARRMMLEVREKKSHELVLGASYREIPALGSEEFSKLEKLLEDSQIPLSEKIKSLHDLPDTLNAQEGQSLLNILQGRLRRRSSENKDLPEDAIDLALFAKIGRQSKSSINSRSADYIAVAAHLMPLVADYGMSQGRTAGEVLGEINPHFLEGNYRRLLTILLIANPFSYRSGRIEKAFSYLHLFALGVSTLIPLYPFVLMMSLPFSSLRLIGTQDLMEPRPGRPANEIKPDLNDFDPEFLAAMKLFYEIFMKRSEDSEFSTQEALTYLRIAVGEEAPPQRDDVLHHEDELELEVQRRLQAAERIKR